MSADSISVEICGRPFACNVATATAMPVMHARVPPPSIGVRGAPSHFVCKDFCKKYASALRKFLERLHVWWVHIR